MQFFRIASILLVVIFASHLAGHLFLIPHLQLTHNVTGQMPSNETEEKLLSLMNHYHRHVGGSSISMMDIQNGLSLCYSIFFLWAGILNLLILKGLVRNKRLLSQISIVNAVVLFIGAWISVEYFFWLPFVSFLVTGILFVVAAFRMQREF
jgi:hypothetical protein